MPKCDYCDVYLTHDSMSVRKAHNSGRNHLRNVVDYYQQIGHEKPSPSSTPSPPPTPPKARPTRTRCFPRTSPATITTSRPSHSPAARPAVRHLWW
ncbi:unnamed protein product [Parascedosporium putredinis]|uniref:Matrin-type domain-containing protein n=1 Tax=Parascedosporium putredinis TaxID=1442378 RepID=A0A9P1H382_9PEZI|nr:unnamed protein product [Parascedosporium putredinis]CAI7995565.1 unnamed protein product [Parascedosporium putredinis]